MKSERVVRASFYAAHVEARTIVNRFASKMKPSLIREISSASD